MKKLFILILTVMSGPTIAGTSTPIADDYVLKSGVSLSATAAAATAAQLSATSATSIANAAATAAAGAQTTATAAGAAAAAAQSAATSAGSAASAAQTTANTGVTNAAAAQSAATSAGTAAATAQTAATAASSAASAAQTTANSAQTAATAAGTAAAAAQTTANTASTNATAAQTAAASANTAAAAAQTTANTGVTNAAAANTAAAAAQTTANTGVTNAATAQAAAVAAQTTASAAIPSAQKATANGVATLDGSALVPIAQLPTGTSGTTVALGSAAAAAQATASAAIPATQKAAANGVATLDGNALVPIAQVPTGTTGTTVALGNDARITGAQQTSAKGGANGYAGLNASALVPVGQIPTGTTSSTVAIGNDARIVGALQSTQAGAASGVATLDTSAFVPVSQLGNAYIQNVAGVGNSSAPTAARVTANQIAQALGIPATDSTPRILISTTTGLQQIATIGANLTLSGAGTGVSPYVIAATGGGSVTFGNSGTTAAVGNDSRFADITQTSNGGAGPAYCDASSGSPHDDTAALNGAISDAMAAGGTGFVILPNRGCRINGTVAQGDANNDTVIITGRGRVFPNLSTTGSITDQNSGATLVLGPFGHIYNGGKSGVGIQHVQIIASWMWNNTIPTTFAAAKSWYQNFAQYQDPTFGTSGPSGGPANLLGSGNGQYGVALSYQGPGTYINDVTLLGFNTCINTQIDGGAQVNVPGGSYPLGGFTSSHWSDIRTRCANGLVMGPNLNMTWVDHVMGFQFAGPSSAVFSIYGPNPWVASTNYKAGNLLLATNTIYSQAANCTSGTTAPDGTSPFTDGTCVDTKVSDGSVIQWANSLALAAGNSMVSNHNVYYVSAACTTASTGFGPSSAGANISDGTCTDHYIAGAQQSNPVVAVASDGGSTPHIKITLAYKHQLSVNDAISVDGVGALPNNKVQTPLGVPEADGDWTVAAVPDAYSIVVGANPLIANMPANTALTTGAQMLGQPWCVAGSGVNACGYYAAQPAYNHSCSSSTTPCTGNVTFDTDLRGSQYQYDGSKNGSLGLFMNTLQCKGSKICFHDWGGGNMDLNTMGHEPALGGSSTYSAAGFWGDDVLGSAQILGNFKGENWKLNSSLPLVLTNEAGGAYGANEISTLELQQGNGPAISFCGNNWLIWGYQQNQTSPSQEVNVCGYSGTIQPPGALTISNSTFAAANVTGTLINPNAPYQPNIVLTPDDHVMGFNDQRSGVNLTAPYNWLDQTYQAVTSLGSGNVFKTPAGVQLVSINLGNTAAVNFLLPAAPYGGEMVNVVNDDPGAHATTWLDSTGAATVTGATSASLATGARQQIIWNGLTRNWVGIASGGGGAVGSTFATPVVAPGFQDTGYAPPVALSVGTAAVPTGATSIVLTGAATQPAFTLTMPPTPADAQRFTLVSQGEITALTLNTSDSSTINAAPPGVHKQVAYSWVYKASSTSWIRQGASIDGGSGLSCTGSICNVVAGTSAVLGGVNGNVTAPAHNWVNGISSAGLPTYTQPGFGDLSAPTGALAFPLSAPGFFDTGYAPAVSPTAGGSGAAPAGATSVVFAGGTTIAGYTYTMPPSPADQQPFTIAPQMAVTGLVLNTSDGSTINTAPTTLNKQQAYTWKYKTSSTQWVRQGTGIDCGTGLTCVGNTVNANAPPIATLTAPGTMFAPSAGDILLNTSTGAISLNPSLTQNYTSSGTFVAAGIVDTSAPSVTATAAGNYISPAGITGVNLTGAVTGYSLTLPPAPVNRQQFTLYSQSAITGLTLTGNGTDVLDSAITAIGAHEAYTWRYASLSGTWRRQCPMVDVAGGLTVNGCVLTGVAIGTAAGTAPDAAVVASTYAPLASPALTGNPTAPTQTAGDNSTKLATDAFVQNAVSYSPTAWTPTFTASTPGDLQVTYTAQSGKYVQTGAHAVFVAGTLSFTPNYTTAAWAAGSYGAAGTTPGTPAWVVSSGNVYHTAASCTAATGDAPTGTSNVTTADGCQWVYVAAAMAGNAVYSLPLAANAIGQQQPLPLVGGVSNFTFPGAGTNPQLAVQSGQSYAYLSALKSGSGSAAQVATALPSGTAVQVSFGGTYLLP